MIPLRSIVTVVVFAVCATWAVSAVAEPAMDARAFVQRGNAKIGALLKQPPSPARTGQIDAQVTALIDFDELARGAVSGAGLNDSQLVEVRELLRRWVGRRYVGRLARAVDYVVAYTEPVAVSPQSWRVRVELRSPTDPREQPLQLDYVVRKAASGFKVVDILTEGASLAQSCHDAFAQILGTSSDGYAALKQRLEGATVGALP